MQSHASLRACLLALAIAACSSDDAGTGESQDPADSDGSPNDGASGDGAGAPTDGSDGAPGDGDGAPSDGSPGDGDGTGDGEPSDGEPSDGEPGDGEPGDGSDDAATYYRADSFVLVAPRAWGTLLGGPLEVTDQVNMEFAKVLVEDNGPMMTPDGILDLNMFVRFADPSAARGDAAVGGGQCTAPLDQSACTPDPMWPFSDVTYTSESTGSCITSAGETVAAPCFVTEKTDVVVTLGAFRNLPLKDFQLSGKLEGTRIESGVIRGFLTETDAMAATLPDDLPSFAALVGLNAGAPLSTALHEDEQETREGVQGWWVTTTVTAAQRDFTP